MPQLLNVTKKFDTVAEWFIREIKTFLLFLGKELKSG